MTNGKDNEAGLEPYLVHLRALPFIRGAQLRDPRAINDPNSKALVLTTPRGECGAYVNWSRSNLSQQAVDHVTHLAGQMNAPYFVFAPTVGPQLANSLEAAGIETVDLAGNCRVHLGDEYVAQIEGRRLAQKTPRQRALRAPSLQVLFTLLAKPKLIDTPVRTIAAATGRISPQTVTDVRKRLVAEEWVSAVGRKHAWVPGGKERALDLLLGEYDRLALHLQVGRMRARPMALNELEHEIALVLKDQIWAFGGGAALERKNGHYRGTRTIVYLEGALPSMSGLLVPDERGEVIFSRFPGAVARDENQDLAPLLIYLDLMTEGQPRAREAAAELRASLFEGDDDGS